MKNVVLFHKAAVVAKVNRPEGFEFKVRDIEFYEQGEEINYSVREEFDSEAERATQRTHPRRDNRRDEYYRRSS